MKVVSLGQFPVIVLSLVTCFTKISEADHLQKLTSLKMYKFNVPYLFV